MSKIRRFFAETDVVELFSPLNWFIAIVLVAVWIFTGGKMLGPDWS